MLITCPECSEKISDKSDVCVHCGYPIKKILESKYKNICIIDGTPYDLSEQLNNINNSQYRPLKQLVEEYGMSIADASNLWRIIKSTNQIPLEYNSSKQDEYRNQLNAEQNLKTPKCPKCGSTAITAGARGVNFTWGFIGASKTVNRCANCGHTWKPGK